MVGRCGISCALDDDGFRQLFRKSPSSGSSAGAPAHVCVALGNVGRTTISRPETGRAGFRATHAEPRWRFGASEREKLESGS